MPKPQCAPGQNSKEDVPKEAHGNSDVLEIEIGNYLLAEGVSPMGRKRVPWKMNCMYKQWNKGRV